MMANVSGSRKRKRHDEVEVTDEGPLTEQPIENEYEDLDVDEEFDDEDEVKTTDEYEDVLRLQEPATIAQYDDIKITPFNLEEELEEGEFDKAGNFIFKREEVDEDNNDTWAESVDWDSVDKAEQVRRARAKTTFSGTAKETTEPVRDAITCYKQMLRIMRANETVQKTIKRLGDSIPKRRPNKKDQSTSSIGAFNPEVVGEIRKTLDLMIELAHQRLEAGDTDIYQKSYENLEDAIN